MLDAEASRLEEVSLGRSERSPADMDETAVRQSPGSPLGVTCAAQRRQSPTKLLERVVVLAQLLEDRGALDVGTCCLDAAQVAGCGLDLASCSSGLPPEHQRGGQAHPRLTDAPAAAGASSGEHCSTQMDDGLVDLAESHGRDAERAFSGGDHLPRAFGDSGLQHGPAQGACPAGVECGGLERLLGRRQQVAHGSQPVPRSGRCQVEYDAARVAGQTVAYPL